MNTLNFCTYIRIFAMMSIVLCHTVAQHDNPYVQMSAQFFNIGVLIFFCLSGFLFGRKGMNTSTCEWYKRRLKRIYIPWLLFVAVLGVIHFVQGHDILTWNWAKLILGIQGTEVGVQGAGHTWFITCLLLCYALTPLLSSIILRVKPRIVCIILACAPIALAIFPMRIFTLLSPVCWYGIAFIAGTKYNDNWLTLRNGMIAMAVAICSLALRFIVRIMVGSSFLHENFNISETFLYDKLCVSYTQFIAALGIMLFLAVLFKGSKVGLMGKYVNDISFEIYLYHYMLCVGPISLFVHEMSWTVSTLLVIVCAAGIATVAHALTDRLTRLMPSNK